MEAWDQDFVDLASPGHITITRGGRGELHFGAVDATIDWRVDVSGERVDFAFEGFDEGDEVAGTGLAELDNGNLIGMIIFESGDESGFVAEKRGRGRSD
jgi:hypothetical protein